MCRLKNVKSFINTKTLAVFALTLLVGLFFNSIFGRYIFKYSITETFTHAEAEAKLNRKVTETCLRSSGNIDGTVVSYKRGADGQISIAIKFDKPIAGKFDELNFDKKVYEKCIRQAD